MSKQVVTATADRIVMVQVSDNSKPLIEFVTIEVLHRNGNGFSTESVMMTKDEFEKVSCAVKEAK